MSLIDSDMFYWRQKKCFSMIDQVKNVTTLIIYSSAWQKNSKAKNHLHHSSDAREEEGEKKSLIWQPILADGRKCRFSIFWQSYVVYVDKGENNCNITAACHEAWKGGFHSKLSPRHVERWMTCKTIPSCIWPDHAGLIFLLRSSWGFSNCPRAPLGCDNSTSTKSPLLPSMP